MTIDTLLSFAFIASLLVISPGPNGLLIAKTVPSSGPTAGFANIAGFVVAFYLHGALSVFGISLILVNSAEAFFVLKLVGASYLFWIGIKSLKDALLIKSSESLQPGESPQLTKSLQLRKSPQLTKSLQRKKSLQPKKSLKDNQRTLRSAFLEGLLTNALNPKVSMFYMAAFPQFITQSEHAISASFTLVLIHSLINLIWFSIMVILFSKITTVATSLRFKRWIQGVTGAVFIGFGIKLALLER